MSFDVSPLLDWAWMFLRWTLDWAPILGGFSFAMVLVKTLYDLSKKTIDSARGIAK